jgi:hypothetical protein
VVCEKRKRESNLLNFNFVSLLVPTYDTYQEPSGNLSVLVSKIES